MSTFASIMRWIVSLFQITFNIYGYSISFWQIFVFMCCAMVASMILEAFLS